MDCLSSIKKSPAIEALPIGVKNHRKVSQISSASLAFANPSTKSVPQSKNLLKTYGTPKSIYARGYKHSGVRTPLEPSSPEGMLLSAILQNHPSLFSFAVSEQLDELASNRDEAAAQKIQSPKPTSTQSILQMRIAEIKEKERQNAVEDVIYMSIVHNFSDVGVPIVPKLSECITDNRLDIWPSKCRELESIHSLEVQELIREHVATVLRTRGKSFLVQASTTTKIDRLDLGRIYAASVLYGYFLRSACLRRQMDISLVVTQENLQPQCNNVFSSAADSYLNRFHSLAAAGQSNNTQLPELCHESLLCDTRPENLRSYVMGFDAETLQRCAKIKSQEAANVIEKHTWALFGGDNDNDNEIVITFPCLERLVMEAVAFGTFLWAVERSVDSTYTLHKN